VINGGGRRVQGEIPEKKTNVLEQKRVRRRRIPSVFSRAEQEEKGNAGHVCSGELEGRT